MISPYSIPNFIVSIYTLILGIVVLRSNPHSDKNKACFLLTCSTFIWLFSYGILYSTTDYSKALIFGKIGHFGAITTAPAVNYFIFAILGPYRKPSEALIIKLTVFVGILATALLFSSPYYFDKLILHFWGYYPLGGPFMIAYALWTFFLACMWLIELAKASNLAKKELRVDDYNRFKYYTLSLFIFIIASIDYLPKFSPHINIYPFGYVFVGAFSSLITFAILRHKLFDVDFVIRRSFAYSALIATITFIYLSIVLLGEYFFRAYFGYASLATAITSSFIIAIVFNPLREKIQKIIDAHFFKIDPEKLARENFKLKSVVQNQDHMKAVATLAAGMAHEIKNPLTAIKTFTEHLPSKANDNSFIRQFTKIVGAEVSKIDSIVKQLLEFSRPAPPELKQIDLREIVENTLSLLESEFVKKQIEVIKKYSADCSTIHSDKKQLQQAFLNLFLNSIQAMPAGGKLEVFIEESAGSVRIAISDTGQGIPKENLPHIFDPFFTTKQNGTGLGLSITHGIFTEHGCKLNVKSQIGAGTTFNIIFPAGK